MADNKNVQNSDNAFILDGMRWSFSSVNAYNTCPKMFKLIYIDSVSKVGNAFAEWGTFMHALLEQYFKHEIEFFELSQKYIEGYADNVKCAFPPNKWVDLGEKYYDRGKEFCDNFDGDFEDYEVVAVEEKVKIQIEGRPFVGVIDLLLKGTDGYVIVDHKSKSKFKSKEERDEYLRQLYLYAIYVKEKFGEYPRQLIFNMVRAGGKEIVNFDEAELVKAKEWFVSTIDAIYADTKFVPYKDDFFCNNLCSVRHSCPNSDDFDSD